MSIDDCITILTVRGVTLEAGLSPTEIIGVEERFGFEFNPDHRRLLETVQPTGERWLDWRNESPASIEARLAWPLEGLLFDVEHDSFWPSTWPKKPDTRAEQFQIAADRIATWPMLVPIFAHRYLPAHPFSGGAPVFSVWQSDVIVYGNDLVDYFLHEFGPVDVQRIGSAPDVGPDTCRPWSLLAFGSDVVD